MTALKPEINQNNVYKITSSLSLKKICFVAKAIVSCYLGKYLAFIVIVICNT
jgi:hypothetical protein